VVGEFVSVPTESNAEADPAAGQVVQRGDRLGEIGSCSTGSATAVANRTRDVTAAAVPRLTHGSNVRS
jgi:hypothetical protein